MIQDTHQEKKGVSDVVIQGILREIVQRWEVVTEVQEEETTQDPAQILPATDTGEEGMRGETREDILQDPLLLGVVAERGTTGRRGPTAAALGILSDDLTHLKSTGTYVIQRIIHDVYNFKLTMNFPTFFFFYYSI